MMTYTNQQIQLGLAEGRSYKRPLENGVNGWEYAKACNRSGYFEHVVIGTDFGGSAELYISYLENSGWGTGGWIEYECE
jgi:hypothetical protein